MDAKVARQHNNNNKRAAPRGGASSKGKPPAPSHTSKFLLKRKLAVLNAKSNEIEPNTYGDGERVQKAKREHKSLLKKRKKVKRQLQYQLVQRQNFKQKKLLVKIIKKQRNFQRVYLSKKLAQLQQKEEQGNRNPDREQLIENLKKELEEIKKLNLEEVADVGLGNKTPNKKVSSAPGQEDRLKIISDLTKKLLSCKPVQEAINQIKSQEGEVANATSLSPAKVATQNKRKAPNDDTANANQKPDNKRRRVEQPESIVEDERNQKMQHNIHKRTDGASHFLDSLKAVDRSEEEVEGTLSDDDELQAKPSTLTTAAAFNKKNIPGSGDSMFLDSLNGGTRQDEDEEEDSSGDDGFMETMIAFSSEESSDGEEGNLQVIWEEPVHVPQQQMMMEDKENEVRQEHITESDNDGDDDEDEEEKDEEGLTSKEEAMKRTDKEASKAALPQDKRTDKEPSKRPIVNRPPVAEKKSTSNRGKIHISWVLKKKMREKQARTKFTGKRITFS